MNAKEIIMVQAEIQAPVQQVWQFYTIPEHVTQWNHASDDWHSPSAENDFKTGGKFLYRMEAKDGSFGFDFWGTYDKIESNKLIEYTLGDGRKVKVKFTGGKNSTQIQTIFEAENTNSVELQRNGWQAILNNFKKYVEKNTHDKI